MKKKRLTIKRLDELEDIFFWCDAEFHHPEANIAATVTTEELHELVRLARFGVTMGGIASKLPLCKIPKELVPVFANIVPGSINVITDKQPEAKPREVISHWCDLYKAKYKASYDVGKKDAGIIAQKCKQWSFEKFSMLFQCYLAIDERFYSEQKHPLSLFFRDIQKINVAAQTGKNPATSAIDKLFKNEELE